VHQRTCDPLAIAGFLVLLGYDHTIFYCIKYYVFDYMHKTKLAIRQLLAHIKHTILYCQIAARVDGWM